MNTFLLASEDPFRHTWNTWDIDLIWQKLHLRAIPICRELGITNVVVVMFVVAAVLMHDLGFTPERGAGYGISSPIVGEITVYQIGEWATAHVIRHNRQAKRILEGV